MRWKNYFVLLGIVLIYMTAPLIISTSSKIQSRLHGCTERFSNANLPLGTSLKCGDNYALANYFETVIDMGLLVIFTFPTGLFAIILLVVVKIISLYR